MAIDTSKSTIQMPTLGRHMKLGTFYDIRTQEIIPGYTFWSESDLTKITTYRNEGSDFALIASDKLSDKFKETNINASLQVSILSGQLELNGSADYLNKKSNNGKDSNVYVRCQQRTAIKSLTMEQLGEGKIRYPKLAKRDMATHVVMQIQYGSEATFTFTDQNNKIENKMNFKGNITVDCGKNLFEILKGKSTVEGNYNRTNDLNERDIKCHFQGDFIPKSEKSPTTYAEAIEFAKKFNQISFDSMAKDDEKEPLGVPIIAWLYPLAKMQENADEPTVYPEISNDLASKYVEIMEDYVEVERKLNSMLQDNLVQQINPFVRKLRCFQRNFISFHDKLKKQSGEMASNIRSGHDSDSFKRELDRIDNKKFAFNPNRLKQWLEEKHKELCMVKRFVVQTIDRISNENTRENVLVFPSVETLQTKMAGSAVHFGFQLDFNLLKQPERFLELMEQQADEADVNQDSEMENIDSGIIWHENPKVLNQIENETKLFSKLIKGSENDESFAFAITASDNEISRENMDGTLIFVHRNGQNYHGSNALLVACEYYKNSNLFDIVKHLTSRQIEINTQNLEGLNALLLVCRNYQEQNLIEIVQLLLAQNIDTNCLDSEGRNAFLNVCRFYPNDNLAEIIRLLLFNGNVDINCKDKHDWNALHFVCRYYEKENLKAIIEFLLQRGILVDRKTVDKKKAKYFLCHHYKHDNLDEILLLLHQQDRRKTLLYLDKMYKQIPKCFWRRIIVKVKLLWNRFLSFCSRLYSLLMFRSKGTLVTPLS